MPARVSPDTTYYFGFFVAPAGTPAPALLWDGFDDPNWQFVAAYATNHTVAAGRFTAPLAAVSGYGAGTNVNFIVRFWRSSTGGPDWSAAKPGIWIYGQSALGTATLGGGAIPNAQAFGTMDAGRIPGFDTTPLCPECIPPRINDPSSAVVGLGGSVTFSVYAGIWPPTGYQWRKEGAPIAGTNSFTQNNENLGQLTITNVTLADAGNYDVVAANAYGTSTSKVATLTVLTPATIGSPKYTLNNQFQFTVTGATGSNYVVQVATNLAPPTTWISLYTNAAPFTFIDSSANTFPQRFYRAYAR